TALVMFYGALSQPFIDTLGLYIAPLQTLVWLDEMMVVVVALVAATVLARHFLAHRAFYREAEATAAPKLKVALDRLGDDGDGLPQLEERASGNRLPADPSQTVLETLEDAGITIDYGCRLGLCGADPIVVVEGEENLEDPSEDELATLRRLGLEGRARLACACRVKQGHVAIDLDLDANTLPPRAPATAAADPAEAAGIGRVVIVGNGAAGTTAATELRRMSPGLDIDLIGAERYPFYNRMGVARLIHKAIGADELFLLDPKRHDDLGITLHRNTQATALDPASQTLTLGTGETLSYDRLILSTGAQAALPPVPGTDLRGVFVIRTAEDAEQIRAFAQSLPPEARRAVVVGGGVLGVEAADALRQLSFRTTILQRSDRLMPRELDEPAAKRLTHFLNLLGITVRTHAVTAALEGEDGRVTGVTIDPSEVIAADLVVFCAGVKPEIALAAQAGLNTDRGILVNEAMQTSDPSIYAIGDAAQTDPVLPALWPISTQQASVASAHLLGVEAPSAASPIYVRLKHDGIAVFSFGQIDQGTDESIEEIVSNAEDDPDYRRLLLRGDCLHGAIVVGMPGAEKFLLRYLSGEPVPAAVLADWR
ncbi:MAG: FAD-dependent oxidoreductase, partial [Pseudomonadota bacterium]|nr:FAD-dependent oxidoreductase [Pseudomonadota bacterium]